MIRIEDYMNVCVCVCLFAQLQPLIAAPLTNQKLCLLEALVNIGDWLHAKKLMDRLPAYSASGYLNVTQALIRLLHYTLEPLYSQ